ncbi:MAG: tetratricopeptide repeat protein [Terracidiphilus sp.]
MKNRWKQFVLAAALAMIVPAQAQTAGIDPSLLAKANGGDAAAQVLVGESYAAGKGVERDLKLAGEWYGKAAAQGDLAGELHLAVLYRDGGKDFPRDMGVAAEWYRKAAEQGDVSAQATMGVLSSIGQGVAQNYVEAYYWLNLAAAVKGPKQEQYAASRQLMGAHITADEQAEADARAAKWLAAHPRTGADE